MNIIEKTQLFSSEKFQKTIRYWKEIFDEGYSSVSILPNSANDVNPKMKSYVFNLTYNQYTSICKLCKNDISIFTYLFTTYSILVYKITGEKKLLFSSPQLKNTEKDYNKLLGIPVNFDLSKTFKEILIKNKDSIANTYKNNIYPLNEIPDIANSILDTELVKNLIFFSELHSEKHIEGIEEMANHEISCRFEKVSDSIRCELRFNGVKHDKFVIQQLCETFSWILSQSLDNIDINIRDISLRENYNISQLIIDKSNDNNIVTIFEEQVRLYPNKTSVVCPTDMSNIYNTYDLTEKLDSSDSTSFIFNRYTYKELNEKANQLAHNLSKKGVKENDVVALVLTPSFDMMISIIAVLKAGGAFLPIDPDFPVNRIDFMLVDSKCKVLITQDYLVDQFSFAGELIDIDNIDLSGELDSNLCKNISHDQLVYMIYTSGTSGQPKGVMLKHENIANYTNWFCDTFKINQNDKSALLSSYAFDLGYTALFTSILSGAEIHIIPKDIYTSMSLLINYIKSEELTYLKLTPSLFSVMIESDEFSSSYLSSLKNVILGGEKLRIKDVEKAYKLCENLLITNHYGPTEATIGCIAKQIKRSEIGEINNTIYNNSIIGLPVRNTQVYILNHENQILPNGLPGEICISGNGLAKGYHNREDLTSERFIELNKNPLLRIYKTGDLGRKLADGNIEFIGRIDSQLKVNGYRIELQEVEKSLNRLKFIDQAVVIPKKDNDQNTVLYAYYKNKLNLSVDDLNNQKKLSDHIIDKSVIKQELDFTNIENIINNKSIKYNEDFISNEEVDQITSKLANEIISKFDETYSLTLREKVRYKRQMLLKDWGIQGQEKLKSTMVFVAGAGGGASPAVIQLALAGFGTIVICDFDTVELSNLNRQVLHNESRIGMNKALSAQLTIRDINPNVNVIPITEKLTKENVYEMVGDCDMIFDMFDGQQDKFLLSECAIAKGIPHFISAMTDINSYASIFHSPHTPCFSCLFDREKLDTLISGMKDTVEGYEKDPLAVVATSLFQSTSIAVNEAIKYVLYPGQVAYNKFFYINQKGSSEISDSPSYQSMIFAYSDHFLTDCRQQGFDWETGGWRGKYLEELEISKNKDCKICFPPTGSKVFTINIKDKYTNNKKTSLKEQLKKSGSIAILTDDLKNIALCLISSLKLNIPIILLDKNNDRRTLYHDLDKSNCRVVLTSSENLSFSEDLVNTFNKNIAIINVDNLTEKETEENIYFKWNTSIIAYYKNSGKDISDLDEYKEELNDVVLFLQNYNKQNIKQLDTYLDTIRIAKNEKLLLTLYNLLLEEKPVLDISGIEISVGNIENRIKDELLKELPNYMIPTHLIEVDSIPLTANGKVDLNALANLELDLEEKIEMPRNKIEEVLCKIWAEVLGIEQVGINQNFFEIGGDSIKAIQISARMQKQGFRLVMADLFKYLKISELSAHVKKSERKIDQSIVAGEMMLTPIQKWYFENNFTDNHYFNLSVMLQRNEGFDSVIVKEVLEAILVHHDALRIQFKKIENNFVQENLGTEQKLIELIEHDLKGGKEIEKEIEKHANELQSSISLSKGGLFKAALFRTDVGDHLLLITHHLVVDGVSWRIILEDFATAYKQALHGNNIRFSLKTDSFQYWTEKLNEYSKDNKLLKEILFWKSFEDTKIKVLPKDHTVEISQKKNRNVISSSISLEEELTNKLLKSTNKAYNTEINDLLLSALALSISEWAETQNVLINLEGHGREEINSEINISRTVGWFTSQYPVLLKVDSLGMLSHTIKSIKETLRQIPVKGIGYGILKYLSPKEHIEGLNLNCYPEISFNYLGEFSDDTIENSVFSISHMPDGGSISPEMETLNTIVISGMIARGKLNLNVGFNKYEYNKETIEHFCLLYEKHLTAIIDHCSSIEEGEKTPSDYGYSKLSLESLSLIQKHVEKEVGKEAEIVSIYPLSPMQRGMLFHSLLDSDSSMYFEQCTMNLHGEVDENVLEKAYNSVINRYAVLKTMFLSSELEEPLQIVLKERPLKVSFYDICNKNESEQALYLEKFKIEDRKNTFDLSKDNLFRVFLIKLAECKYHMIWDFHHILMDGWDSSIIYKDILKAYNSIKKNQKISIKENYPYKNYIDWLQEQDKDSGLKFWKEYLSGYESSGLLSRIQLKNTNPKIYNKSECKLIFDEKVTREIVKLTSKQNVTINSFFQTLWGLLLQKYSNSNDIVYGAVVSGRPASVNGVEEMIGLFINTIPVRITSGSDDSFIELLNKTQRVSIDTKAFEYLLLAEIQSLTEVKNNLIDHIMVFENFPINEEMSKISDFIDLGFEIADMNIYEQANYNLSIKISSNDKTAFSIKYNSNAYCKEGIERLSNHFNNILHSVLICPEKKISEIELISEKEKQAKLSYFNEKLECKIRNKTIQGRLQECYNEFKDKIAIEIDDNYISYSELEVRKRIVTNWIIDKDIKKESLVGILVDDRANVIISILGILDSSCIFVPIDINLPANRIKGMIESIGINYFVTCDEGLLKLSEIIPGIKRENVLEINNVVDIIDVDFYEDRSLSSDAIYIYFTSGSTGKPKPIVGKNESLLQFIEWEIDQINADDSFRVSQLINIGFDVFLRDIFLPLLSGGTICIPPDNYIVLDRFQLTHWINRKQITLVHCVPSVFNMFSNEYIENYFYKGLRYVLMSGEQILPSNLVKWYSVFGNRIQLVNLYGPTETTLARTCYFIKPEDVNKNRLTIGQAIVGSRILILDNDKNVCDSGMSGELYIRTAYSSLGYYKDNMLTREKFVNNPFKKDDNILLYCTGDLAVENKDGEIEIIGRIDHQIKIRGFRIELGEIESVLLKQESIKECVVVAYEENGDKYICAYIVSEIEFRQVELRAFMSKYLPDYMIPSNFVELDSLPLSPNGKINRKALPPPEVNAGNDYLAPTTNNEKKMVAIWAEILAIPPEKISITANFFTLGGHSLKATVLTSKIHKEFDVNIPLADFFKQPTIQELLQLIEIVFNMENIQVDNTQEKERIVL